MRNEIEIMRVLRIPPLGKLVVEVNEQRYEDLTQITDSKLKQRVMAAIGELVTFVGGYQNLVDVGVAPALNPVVATTAVADETQESVSPDLARQREAFLAQLEAQRAELAAQPPRGGLRLFIKAEPVTNAQPLVAFTETGDVKPVSEPPKPQSIAEQIDAILQKHLDADPTMSGRIIHLRQNAAGGLRIEVDGKDYDKPADIADKDVQMVIKTAVKEWNAS